MQKTIVPDLFSHIRKTDLTNLVHDFPCEQSSSQMMFIIYNGKHFSKINITIRVQTQPTNKNILVLVYNIEFNNKLLGGAVVSKIGFKLYQMQPTNKNILVLVSNIEFNNKLLGGVIVPKIGFKLHLM